MVRESLRQGTFYDWCETRVSVGHCAQMRVPQEHQDLPTVSSNVETIMVAEAVQKISNRRSAHRSGARANGPVSEPRNCCSCETTRGGRVEVSEKLGNAKRVCIVWEHQPPSARVVDGSTGVIEPIGGAVVDATSQPTASHSVNNPASDKRVDDWEDCQE